MVHIYFEVGLISGVGVGLTNTVSKMLLCTVLDSGWVLFQIGSRNNVRNLDLY